MLTRWPRKCWYATPAHTMPLQVLDTVQLTIQWVSWPKASYNLGSCSWLIWANDIAVHYMACISTVGTTMQPADIPPPQRATPDFRPVACKLLLISHPTESRRQRWHGHTLGQQLAEACLQITWSDCKCQRCWCQREDTGRHTVLAGWAWRGGGVVSAPGTGSIRPPIWAPPDIAVGT